MVRAIVSMAAFACAAAATPAYASQAYTKVQGRVSFAGLDLRNPHDITKFEKRLVAEARLICRRGVPQELRFSPEVEDCRDSVVANGKSGLARLIAVRRGPSGN